MKLLVLLVAALLAEGCSQAAPAHRDRSAGPRRRPPLAEEQLRLDYTSVRIWKEGSRATFAVMNRTPVDLCIARDDWVGETQETTRVYAADGHEYAYRGELTPVTGDVRPPVRIRSGETLRIEADLSKSYQVDDWSAAKIVYSPIVSICVDRPRAS